MTEKNGKKREKTYTYVSLHSKSVRINLCRGDWILHVCNMYTLYFENFKIRYKIH